MRKDLVLPAVRNVPGWSRSSGVFSCLSAKIA
jgi:hypothetical protein